MKRTELFSIYLWVASSREPYLWSDLPEEVEYDLRVAVMSCSPGGSSAPDTVWGKPTMIVAVIVKGQRMGSLLVDVLLGMPAQRPAAAAARSVVVRTARNGAAPRRAPGGQYCSTHRGRSLANHPIHHRGAPLRIVSGPVQRGRDCRRTSTLASLLLAPARAQGGLLAPTPVRTFVLTCRPTPCPNSFKHSHRHRLHGTAQGSRKGCTCFASAQAG
eukprot:6197462-Pleurochrysis_carterae.AAC.5